MGWFNAGHFNRNLYACSTATQDLLNQPGTELLSIMAVASAALHQPPRNAGSPSAIWGTPYIWGLTKIWTNFIDSTDSSGVQSAVCVSLGEFEPLKMCHSWCPFSACHSFRVSIAEMLALQQLVSLLSGGNLRAGWYDLTSLTAYSRLWPPSCAYFHSCHVVYVSILAVQPLDLISMLCFLVSVDSVFNEVINLQ